jgi:hypothetical protein
MKSSSPEVMIEGYEHVHPDIARMLVGDGLCCDGNDVISQSLSSTLLPFDVDPKTFTLHLTRQHHSFEEGYGSFTIIPTNQLALFANRCDDVVFGKKNPGTVDVPKKILGLIYLSLVQPSSSSSLEGSSNPSAILVSSMVATNLLESSIRSVLLKVRPQNNHHQKMKGSPLLSSMVEEISKLDKDPSLHYNRMFPLACITPILQTLLLPTKIGGVNLRNLLSHGFLSTLHRRWLSLTLVLICTLDSCVETQVPKMNATTRRNITYDFTKYELMKREVDFGRLLISSSSRMRELESVSCCYRGFVPSSHADLLRFTLHVLGASCFRSNNKLQTSVPPLTAIFITSMSSLLEHSLRLIWCRVNDRIDDSIARPASYYVTLDGHGQKGRHEVILSPYLRDDCTRNKLVVAVGVQECALLTDLFASPSSSESPNIRAAVCHGYFDNDIVEELESLVDWTLERKKRVVGPPKQEDEKDNTTLTDAACALLSAFDLISSNVSGKPRRTEYKPLFTYTSMVMRDLHCVLNNLSSLNFLVRNDKYVTYCIEKIEQHHRNTLVDISSTKIELGKVREMADKVFPKINETSTPAWGIEEFYSNHKTNIILADCKAAQSLLTEVSHAAKRYLESVEFSIGGVTVELSSTKDRRTKKSSHRICGVASLVLNFYCTVTYVALIAIIDHHDISIQSKHALGRADVTKAVERSRMTVSTFDTFLFTNLDRSIKSLQQYLQGKAVKKLLMNIKDKEV